MLLHPRQLLTMCVVLHGSRRYAGRVLHPRGPAPAAHHDRGQRGPVRHRRSGALGKQAAMKSNICVPWLSAQAPMKAVACPGQSAWGVHAASRPVHSAPSPCRAASAARWLCWLWLSTTMRPAGPGWGSWRCTGAAAQLRAPSGRSRQRAGWPRPITWSMRVRGAGGGSIGARLELGTAATAASISWPAPQASSTNLLHFHAPRLHRTSQAAPPNAGLAAGRWAPTLSPCLSWCWTCR